MPSGTLFSILFRDRAAYFPRLHEFTNYYLRGTRYHCLAFPTWVRFSSELWNGVYLYTHVHDSDLYARKHVIQNPLIASAIAYLSLRGLLTAIREVCFPVKYLLHKTIVIFVRKVRNNFKRPPSKYRLVALGEVLYLKRPRALQIGYSTH